MRGGKKYFKISRSGYDELCYEARHIAPNGSRLCAVPNKTVQMFNFKTKVK